MSFLDYHTRYTFGKLSIDVESFILYNSLWFGGGLNWERSPDYLSLDFHLNVGVVMIKLDCFYVYTVAQTTNKTE
jgi:hypothetical protein